MVAVQRPRRLDAVQQGQPGIRAVGHPDGHGAVQLVDRRRPQAQQLGVQRRDLQPGRVLRPGGQPVLGRDGRLQLVGAGPPAVQGAV
jgi:hypothetical protein